MKLIKEHINFKRGIEPKEAMGHWEDPKKSWANFAADDEFILIHDMPVINRHHGDIIKIERIINIGGSTIEFNYFKNGDYEHEHNWTVSFDFFCENFRKII